MWSASDLDGRSRDWAIASLKHFLPLTKEAHSGVTLQRMREVYAEKVPDPWYRERLPFFQRLSKHEMRGSADWRLFDGCADDHPANILAAPS